MSTLHVDGYNTSVEITITRNENGKPKIVTVRGCDEESNVGPAAVRQALNAEGFEALNISWEGNDAYVTVVAA